jgi:hypothetical protein
VPERHREDNESDDDEGSDEAPPRFYISDEPPARAGEDDSE